MKLFSTPDGTLRRNHRALFIHLLILPLLTACTLTRGGYESAPYRSVSKEAEFEVRDYPTMMVVETPSKNAGTGPEVGFGRLFKFISGRNEKEQKISMTTPVFMSGREANATMAFVMPATMTPEALPKPDDKALTAKQMPAGRYAVLRFTGARSREREDQALQQLQSWMLSQKLAPEGIPIFGYFDPPWTPSFLRRNEVMLLTTGGAP